MATNKSGFQSILKGGSIIGRMIKMKTAQRNEDNYVSGEFFPDRVYQAGDWICPLCLRTYHKEPGQFKYGATPRENENSVALWIESPGCCKWTQIISLEEFRELLDQHMLKLG